MQEVPTIVIKDEMFLKHDPGFGHPESPSRLQAIYGRIAQDDVRGLYEERAPRMATNEELCWNHSPDYIDRIKSTKGQAHHQLDPDTATSEHSWEAACLAVGGVFEAVDMVFDESNGIHAGLALVRPPGHHAEREHAMGFCLFNNVALGAHYAIERKDCKKVLIVDWDLHHGNGTQHSFYDRDDVLYFSTHQFPYYPGTGALTETGKGRGEGFTVNCPLPPGIGDDGYASVFRHLLIPIAQEYSPDLILVSAGFDTYKDDPLGGMNVTGIGFSYMAMKLLEIARESCNGRIVFCLEGGYDLNGLKEGICAVIRAIAEEFTRQERSFIQNEDRIFPNQKNIMDAISYHKRFWKAIGHCV